MVGRAAAHGGAAARRLRVRAPMCGIVGILAFNGAPVDPTVLDRMNNRQGHRGPDGAGYLFAWPDEGGFADVLVRDVAQWGAAVGAHRHDVRAGLGPPRPAILDLPESGVHPTPPSG